MATQKKGTQRTSSVIGGAIAILGLASFTGGISHTACLLSAFFSIPQRPTLNVFLSLLLAAWHWALVLSGYMGLLKSLLHLSGCCLHLLLAFEAVA